MRGGHYRDRPVTDTSDHSSGNSGLGLNLGRHVVHGGQMIDREELTDTDPIDIHAELVTDNKIGIQGDGLHLRLSVKTDKDGIIGGDILFYLNVDAPLAQHRNSRSWKITLKKQVWTIVSGFHLQASRNTESFFCRIPQGNADNIGVQN